MRYFAAQSFGSTNLSLFDIAPNKRWWIHVIVGIMLPQND
jgi:hypothetical protein